MAAGPLNVPDVALTRFGGQLDLDNPDLWAVLCDNSQALGVAFVGASGQALYSDLTGEVVGAGYTAGGEQLTGVTWSGAPVATLDASAITWAAATFTAKYLVIVDRSVSSEPIVMIGDLEETDPSGRTSAGGDFTVSFPSGLQTLTRA